jgi:hypothetical protein
LSDYVGVSVFPDVSKVIRFKTSGNSLTTLGRLTKNLPFEDSALLGCERDRVAVLVFPNVSKALSSFEATDDTNPETDYMPEDLLGKKKNTVETPNP